MNEYLDIAECKVTASYDNNKVTAESKVLTIKPTTISLNFMRYLPAKSQRKESFLYPLRESETKYNVEGAPQIKDWDYKASSLREGYLYLYFENKPDLFKEFKVEVTGLLTNIMSDLSADVRIQADSYSKKYYCISTEDVIWIAYSEYQWSAKYIRKIRNEASVREKRMQKFDGPSFTEGNAMPDTFSVNEIDGYFPLSDIDTSPKKTKDHGTIYWTPGHFTNGMDAYLIPDWKSYYDNVRVLEDKPDEQTEVFFCLHDPVGCAEELAGDLSFGVLQMQALVQSIQTGWDQNVLLEGLISDKAVNISPNEEFLSLFKLAQTVYFLVYNNEKNIDDFNGGEAGWDLFRKGGVDLPKIEGILGVKERERLRADLNARRDLLGNFVKSDYLQNVLDDYSEHNPEGNLAGIVKMFGFLQVLFNNPADYEMTLLLNKDKPPKLDNWQKFILGQIDADASTGDTEKLHSLLSKQLDIDQAYTNTINLSNKLASYGVAQMTFLSKKAFATREFNGKVYTNTDDLLQIVVSKMNRVTVYGESMYHFKDGQIELRLRQFGAEMKHSVIRFGRYEGSATGVIRIVEGSDGFNLVSSRKGKHVLELAVEKPGKELSKSEITINTINNKAAKILNGTSFTGTVAFLQLLNMRMAVEYIIENHDAKSGINLIGVTSELTEASLNFYVAFRNSMGKKLSEQVTRNITRNTLRAGIIGNGVTAILCVWDSIESFKAGDVDAAVALAGAGVAFGTAAGYQVYLLATGAKAGPLGWIAALTGFSLIGLAFYLKDTPAEHYFKNFLLRNRHILNKDTDESPVSYTWRILKAKETLVKPKYHQLFMLPSDAAASLFDIFVCRQVYFKGDTNISVSRSKRGGVYEVKKFRLEIAFFGLLNNTDQFDYDLYFYTKGLTSSRGTRLELSKDEKAQHTLSIIDKEAGLRCIKVEFSLFEEWAKKANDDSEMLIIFRLKVDPDSNMNFPYDLSTKKNRFMAAKTKVKYSNPTGLFSALEAMSIGNTRSTVKIDEKIELLDTRNW